MSTTLTLSVDAMGGDTAPRMVVEGIETALDRHADVAFLLFGDRERIEPLISRSPRLRDACQVRHTSEVVTDDVRPSVALRTGRKSSMRLAIDAVAADEAAGVISAGNTGALMAMAKYVLKTIPGVDRPAIAGCYPTQRGESVMLDLGANVQCTAENLVQFAVMGEVFARHVLGIEQPSVGLLNVGVEEGKGNAAVKKAATILQETDLPIRFCGFVEGDAIGAGTVDVIVTDGFTGNIVLKTTEGMARLFGQFLREALTRSPMARLGAMLAGPALETFKLRLDPRRYNGAMFLGLNAICVKSHGSTDGVGFANAIDVAIELVTNAFNDGIKQDFQQLNGSRRQAPLAALGS